MTVDVRDILIKAAEDVQSGMWCRAKWFSDYEDAWSNPELDWDSIQVDEAPFLVYENVEVDQLQATLRCAEGSLILATRLLGGTADDYTRAEAAVVSYLNTGELSEMGYSALYQLNDWDLPDDPFEAGQQLAELFRQAADA